MYSTSNVNTPNIPKRESAKVQAATESKNLPMRPPVFGQQEDTEGRLTLRSLHLTSTDEMKADAANEALIESRAVGGQPSTGLQQNVERAVLSVNDESPVIRGSSKGARVSSALSVSEQNGIPTARKASHKRSGEKLVEPSADVRNLVY